MHDLSEKINELIKNDEMRKRLGGNGLGFINEVYDYKKIISEMENILTANEP